MGFGHHATSLQEPPGMHTLSTSWHSTNHRGLQSHLPSPFGCPLRWSWGELDLCLPSDVQGGKPSISVLLVKTSDLALNALSFIRGPLTIKKITAAPICRALSIHQAPVWASLCLQ